MTLGEIQNWLTEHRGMVVEAFRAEPERLGKLSECVEPGDDPEHAVLCLVDSLLKWPGLAEGLPRGFNDFLRNGRVRPGDYSEATKRRVDVLGFVRNAIISAQEQAGEQEPSGGKRPDVKSPPSRQGRPTNEHPNRRSHLRTDNCDPDDDHMGDYWDHIAYDPEHRLVLAVIPGALSIENAEAIVGEVKQRLGGLPPNLITSDEYPAYETAIERGFGEPIPSTRGPGRPRIEPELRLPRD